MPLTLIDSHAHLDLQEFAPDFEQVLTRADDAGVSTIITVGIDLVSSKKAIELSNSHYNVYATIGLHPCDAAMLSDEIMRELKELASHPKVVAIGETGLDFYHKTATEEQQLVALMFQLELAVQSGKPVVIHSRQADNTIAPILISWAEANPNHPKGVIHCLMDRWRQPENTWMPVFYISWAGL